MVRCGELYIAEDLFIPEVTEARVPSLPHRNDPTGDHADGNLREDSAPQSPSGYSLPKIESLMSMQPFIFHLISFLGAGCKSLTLCGPIRACTGQQLRAMSPRFPSHYSWAFYWLYSLFMSFLHPSPVLLSACLVSHPRGIVRLHILAWSVLLGANTHQSLLLGFPLLCDCSNLQVMLYNPVIPELLQGILSHKSLSNSRFCSFSSFSLPLSPTTPFPFLWFLSSLSCFYRKPQPNPSRGFIIHSAISALFPGKLGLVFSLSILSKYLIASQLQIWRKPLNFSLSLHCPVACQNNLKKKWLYEIDSLHYWNPDWPVQLSRG